jgi:7-cyano-7-deazaguanine synthase
MITLTGHGPIGLLLSGGLDSAILLVELLRREERVTPIYVRSNLSWEPAELASVRDFLAAIAEPRLESLVILDLPVDDLYGEHWSVTGERVPDQSTPDEAVFLPGRNPLLIIKAAIWCQLHGMSRLALAPLGSNPFPDATDAFFGEFSSAMSRAMATPIEILRPFAGMHKSDVMRLAGDAPLELTFSCIAPQDGLHCGKCNKCAERKSAFASVSAADPTRYADRLPRAKARPTH